MDYKKRYMMIKDELSKLEDKESNLALLLIDNINDLEEKYPELKESEDKRIIERIKKAVESYWSDEPLDEILSWLEKQGEQKPQRMVSAEAKEAMYNKLAWSKEDEKIANSIWDSIDKSVLANYGVNEDKAFEWLSHIKDRIQPKQK